MNAIHTVSKIYHYNTLIWRKPFIIKILHFNLHLVESINEGIYLNSHNFYFLSFLKYRNKKLKALFKLSIQDFYFGFLIFNHSLISIFYYAIRQLPLQKTRNYYNRSEGNNCRKLWYVLTHRDPQIPKPPLVQMLICGIAFIFINQFGCN